MSYSNIPSELKDLPQWVVWRMEVREGTNTKVPYNPYNPGKRAITTDPSTWGDYEQALRVCRSEGSPFGLGFVFGKDDPYIGIDFDALEKVSSEGTNRALRQQIEADMLAAGSYWEWSPSGKGKHIIARGSLGERTAHVNRLLQIEVYARDRFFTMSGKVDGEARPILDMTELLAQYAEAFPRNDMSKWEEIDLAETTASGRLLDMTDEQVLTLAFQVNGFHDRYHGINIKDWSQEHRNLIGDLDKVSGDPEQVRRLVYGSPLVKEAAPRNGETREHKSARIFDQQLGEVRANYANREANYQNNPRFIQHGREIYARMQEYKLEQAKALAERMRIADEAIGNLSAHASSLLDAFPELTTEHRALTRPPGMAGQYVEATERKSRKPFTKFAIPATFSTLAGILSRGNKLPDGTGINLNFILGAGSNAGKTQTMKAWESFINEAMAQLGKDARSPIINSSASSIQSLLNDFMAVPSVVWYIEECADQLDGMYTGEGQHGQLRDAYNQMWDVSSHGFVYSGPKSIAAQKRDFVPINNLNVSTYWTTVTGKLDVYSEDALDGFLSRVIMIRHTGRGGEPSRYQEPLPDNLKLHLTQLLDRMVNINEEYTRDVYRARTLLNYIDNADVDDLNWEMTKRVDVIANMALEGQLPVAYGAVSRIPVNAMRMAGVMAVLENPFGGARITVEQYKWAFGYILQNAVVLLSDLDQGEMGADMSKDIHVVARVIRRYMAKHKAVGMPRKEISDQLRRVKPFKGQNEPGAVISRTLQDMVNNELLTIIEVGTNGRPAQMYCPTEATLWQS